MVTFGDTVFHTLFDPLPQAVLVLRDGAIAYANGAASQLLGSESSQLVGSPIDRYLDSRTAFHHLTPSPPLSGSAKSDRARGSTSLIRGDGSLCNVEIESEPLEVGATPAVRLTIRNSSEPPRQVADREVSPGDQRTKTAESELRALFRVLQDHFLRIDAQGRILEYFAPENASPFLSPMEFIGRPMQEMLPLEIAETFTDAIESALDSGRVKTLEYALPLAGLTRHFESRIVPYAADRLIAIVRDVTDRKRADEEKLVARKLESIERLAGGIAHEFNNLLTAMMAHGELLRFEVETNPNASDHVDSILDSAARAADLTRKLLAFSRSHVSDAVAVDVRELLVRLTELFGRTFGDDIAIRTMLKGRHVRVLADPKMLEKAIFNVVLNAREAMPHGGSLVIAMREVEVGPIFAAKHFGMRAGSYCAIFFRDSGFGMDEATLRRAFDPFFTTKPAGSSSGLGLPTTHGIVKQLGGHVFALSRRGRGTTVALYLPRIAIDSAHSTEAPPSTLAGRRRRILIAEDEEAVREVVSRSISNAGFVVDACENGSAALAKYRAERAEGRDYDAVITDVVMPLMGGRELVQGLRAECANVKVLFMSGYTASALGPSDLAVPGTGFVQKPFAPGALLAEIEKLLEIDSAPVSSRL